MYTVYYMHHSGSVVVLRSVKFSLGFPSRSSCMTCEIIILVKWIRAFMRNKEPHPGKPSILTWAPERAVRVSSGQPGVCCARTACWRMTAAPVRQSCRLRTLTWPADGPLGTDSLCGTGVQE